MSNRNSSNEEYVTAYEALKMQSDQEELDMRPYLLDGNSGQHILLDSGSQVCAWPPDAGDIPDPKMRLKAVNGSKLKCYGYKKVEVKIGRKTYDIEAVKTDVQKPILGWNFTRKHKLTTSWTTWGDMELSDPKAKIKQILKYRSVHDQTHRLSVLKKPENTQKSAEQMLFEMASVEALGQEDIETVISENDIEQIPDGNLQRSCERVPRATQIFFQIRRSKKQDSPQDQDERQRSYQSKSQKISTWISEGCERSRSYQGAGKIGDYRKS